MNSKATAIRFKQPTWYFQNDWGFGRCTKERLHQLVLKKLWHVLPKPAAAAETLFNVIFNARQKKWPHDMTFRLTGTIRQRKKKKKKKRPIAAWNSAKDTESETVLVFFHLRKHLHWGVSVCPFVLFIVPSIGSEKAERITWPAQPVNKKQEDNIYTHTNTHSQGGALWRHFLLMIWLVVCILGIWRL